MLKTSISQYFQDMTTIGKIIFPYNMFFPEIRVSGCHGSIRLVKTVCLNRFSDFIIIKNCPKSNFYVKFDRKSLNSIGWAGLYRSEGLNPNGIFGPWARWSRGLARWESCWDVAVAGDPRRPPATSTQEQIWIVRSTIPRIGLIYGSCDPLFPGYD